MHKITYDPGTLFSLPLRNGGFGLGLVAQMSKNKRGVVLGYFSNKRFENIPTLEEAQNAIDFPYMWRFGDLSLINGDWTILGQKSNFKSEDWPMPLFIRKDPLSNKAWIIKYKRDDALSVESETPIDYSVENIEPDSLKGAGAVEIGLGDLL